MFVILMGITGLIVEFYGYLNSKKSVKNKILILSSKMTNPKVSLITIVYNGEKHLEKTILSVLKQNYSPIEYIIIDGGSKDKTLEIINKYSDRISFWSTEPDKGISDALNKGLKQAKGEVVGFINSDDWLEDGAIEIIMKNYEPGKIVYGNIRFWKKDKITGESKSDHTRLREGMTMAHPAVYVPKKLYDDYGLFDLDFKIAMDYELLVRLFIKKAEFVKIDAIIVNMNLGGISHKKWIWAIREDLRVKNIYFNNKLLNYYYFLKQFTYLFFERTFRKLNY